MLGIGNAMVDVVAQVDNTFLSRHDMHKGTMILVDAERGRRASTPRCRRARRAVAGPLAIPVRWRRRWARGSRISARWPTDQLGAVFRHDISAAGVHFPSAPLIGGAPTARCLMLVTPDGQRTMNTYPRRLRVVRRRRTWTRRWWPTRAITYLEGYLFDPPAAQAAFRRAAATAHAAGRQVALSLSDAFCVDRHRAAFRDLVAGDVDILFANESEITSLYEENTFEAAAEAVRRDVALAALTRSEAGSVILRGTETVEIAAEPTRVVDTTGAGDAYAAGFLAGLTAGRSLPVCGRMGAIAAAEVISHYGARPEADLKRLIAGRL